jgi:hypothetical protein
VSLCDWCPIFWDGTVFSSSRLDIWPILRWALSQNFGLWSCSDVAPYPRRRKETSTSLLQEHKKSLMCVYCKVCVHVFLQLLLESFSFW